jgi:hypothetical protein
LIGWRRLQCSTNICQFHGFPSYPAYTGTIAISSGTTICAWSVPLNAS